MIQPSNESNLGSASERNNVDSLFVLRPTVIRARCQSPSEAKMLDALVALNFNTEESLIGEARATLYQKLPIATANGICLLDFALIRRVGQHFIKVAIEVDDVEGQPMSDERDFGDDELTRALAKQGWFVARFSAQEIMKDAEKCALDAAAIVIENLDRLTRVTT